MTRIETTAPVDELISAAAYATGTGVITVRKAGKLPRGVGVVMELEELGGRTALDGHRVSSLLRL